MRRWGWVVADPDRGCLLQLCDPYRDEPPGPRVLLFGRTPTVFPTYHAARNALRVTVTRSTKRGDEAPVFGSRFKIIRVEVLE